MTRQEMLDAITDYTVASKCSQEDIIRLIIESLGGLAPAPSQLEGQDDPFEMLGDAEVGVVFSHIIHLNQLRERAARAAAEVLAAPVRLQNKLRRLLEDSDLRSILKALSIVAADRAADCRMVPYEDQKTADRWARISNELDYLAESNAVGGVTGRYGKPIRRS